MNCKGEIKQILTFPKYQYSIQIVSESSVRFIGAPYDYVNIGKYGPSHDFCPSPPRRKAEGHSFRRCMVPGASCGRNSSNSFGQSF